MQKCDVEKQHDITMFSVFTTQITQPTTDYALLQTYANICSSQTTNA